MSFMLGTPIKNTKHLNAEELRAVAPSVFAEHKASSRSERYTFIPTIRLVERLAREGWMPTKATEQRVKTQERQGFQKHMIRFRKYDGTEPVLRVGDSFVEMVLVNSHDGSSAYQLDAGLYRLICSNGMVVADSAFESLKFKHAGFDPKEIIEASYRVIDNVPRIQADVKEMSNIILSPAEQLAFGEAALQLKYNEDNAPAPERVIASRRSDDQKPDLWTTYNRVQENLIKGGLKQPSLLSRDEETGRTTVRRRHTRGINGIDENIKLNKALWSLTESMKAIKTAA